MSKIALRLVAALLTFTLGIIVTMEWVIPHFQRTAQRDSSSARS